MNGKIRLQLSAMMFLQFFVWGAWFVTAPNYLGTIGFTAGDIGWTYAVGPIAAIIAPFFALGLIILLIGIAGYKLLRRRTGNEPPVINTAGIA